MLTFRDISYELHLNPTGSSCQGIQGEREGIEFAIRNSSEGRWTPLQFHYFGSSTTSSTKLIRGHNVRVTRSNEQSALKQVSICGELLCTSDVQFRWLGTAYLSTSMTTRESLDLWALSNVTATIFTANSSETKTLFSDSFGSDVLK